MRRTPFLAIAAIAAGTVFPTAVTFAETPDATAVVRDAAEQAGRAANIEGALEGLEQEGSARRDGTAAADALVEAARTFRPLRLPQSPSEWQQAGLDISKADVVEGELVQTLADGTKVVFTVDPSVQRELEKMFDNYNVPHGGSVLIDPPTGRVLALVSHTEADNPIEGISMKSTAPSASVFKVVTAAALMEGAGIDPDAATCYHGGRSSLTKRNIEGDKRRDTKCATLDSALAWSINSIMAKLAYNHLEQDALAQWAERFGYNQPIPFELPVEVSTAEFVDDPYERARTAAGFWHTYLSPLHGAMIGAALANDGVMMQPSIIDRVVTPDGKVSQQFEPRVFRKVMEPETARRLGVFMEKTTQQGTARKFFNRRGFPNDITVSGKTGTLSNKDPYLGFTWFVGYAERNGVRVGVSGLACNTPIWRIKGGFAASEAVREFFESQPKNTELARHP